MVSEEDKDPIIVKDSKGHYMAVFDPLVRIKSTAISNFL